ncbi:MAG TPA: carboxyltransferase domain-containing protein, partial [Opitutaceae bacterium]|nr:carboxyltransferase domain-containing protein [Opitutaceae bacterium]
MTLSALGDSAVVIALGEGIDEQVLARVRALTAALEQDRLPGVVDVVPAYATVTVFYDPAEVAATGERPFERISRLVTERAGR